VLEKRRHHAPSSVRTMPRCRPFPAASGIEAASLMLLPAIN
jgi:hypothetical protein